MDAFIREDWIVQIAGVDVTRMLEFWRWLLPETVRPHFATALGDLFLTDESGRVLWLDAGSGRLREVATSLDDFRRATADPKNAAYWFGPVLVEELRAAGQVLLPYECYSYRTLPVLGGGYEPGNFVIYPLVRHFRVCGQMHEQLRHLPDGATVEFKLVE